MRTVDLEHFEQLAALEVSRAVVARPSAARTSNKVTNPAARNTPRSPIYRIPILDVDKAQAVVVLERSMRPGFAGIDNELYAEPKTAMLFGDAKQSVQDLVQAVKQV